MDSSVIYAIVALVVVAALAVLLMRRQRTEKLRQRFGPEYSSALQTHGDRAKAEAELEARAKRVAKLEIRPLAPAERDRFAESWKTTQARFVDSPPAAIAEANKLVKELMAARGYPMGDFEQRAADISVDHPQVVENYRAARAIAQANERNEAGTEDLRQAMVHYRALFVELLETGQQEPAPEPVGAGRARETGRETARQTEPAPYRTRKG
jgi:hypothetical protein